LNPEQAIERVYEFAKRVKPKPPLLPVERDVLKVSGDVPYHVLVSHPAETVYIQVQSGLGYDQLQDRALWRFVNTANHPARGIAVYCDEWGKLWYRLSFGARWKLLDMESEHLPESNAEVAV
jgi:hypothetical protein